MHISNHIYEWHRHSCLIKFEIPDQLLTEWFTKSFVPKIEKYLAMGGCVIEEEVITRAQYIDLVYSKFGNLYELLLDASRPSTNPASSQSHVTPPVDGVIGTMPRTDSSVPKTSSNSKSIVAALPATPSHNQKNPGKTSEVNVIQSTATNKSLKGKKKGK